MTPNSSNNMAHISNAQDQDGWQDEDSDDDLEDDEDSSDEEVLPLRYDSGCRDLPTNRPLGYPHIIVSQGFNEQTDKTDLRFADGVATLLWKWNAEQFNAFFDLSKPRFEMLRKNGPGMIKYTMIARLDNVVIVSRSHSFLICSFGPDAQI